MAERSTNTMAERAVLVSYLDSKKAFRIPQGKGLGFLIQEFVKAFSFENNVNLKITFQRYNSDWEEYVDLDEEMDEVCHKDKLKAIVTPLLLEAETVESQKTWSSVHSNRRFGLDDDDDDDDDDTCASTSHYIPAKFQKTPPSTVKLLKSVRSHVVLDDDDDDDDDVFSSQYVPAKSLNPPPMKTPPLKPLKSVRSHGRVVLDKDYESAPMKTPPLKPLQSVRSHGGVVLDKDDESASTSYSCHPITDEEGSDISTGTVSAFTKETKKRFLKTEDDDVPLPDPFPLPKHYRMDVETALKSGKMNRQTRSAFFSSIASAILQYKRYPDKEDYIIVAHSIISKYPFFKTPGGANYGAIMESLRDRFKEFRRQKKPRITTTKSTTKLFTSKKSPGITRPMFSPPVPVGEDKISFNRHTNALKAEWKKRRPNTNVVNELMDQSFAMRWDDLHSNAYDVDTIFQKYPFLQNNNQLIRDLGRYLKNDDIVKQSVEKFDVLVPKIFQQAEVEREQNSRLDDLLKKHKLDEKTLPMAIMILVYMITDVRTKADGSKVIYFTQGATNIESIVEDNNRPEPYIVVLGTPEHCTEAYLAVDCKVVTEVSFSDIPVILMAAFFVFNIYYPIGCTNFYSFLEIIVMDYPLQRSSLSVKHLYTSLNTL